MLHFIDAFSKSYTVSTYTLLCYQEQTAKKIIPCNLNLSLILGERVHANRSWFRESISVITSLGLKFRGEG